MKDKDNDLNHDEDSWEKKAFKDLYGLEPEMSLQTAQFATTENPLLTEYYQERHKADE